MADSLQDSSSASYTLFVLYTACCQFLVANIIVATFAQLTMKFMQNAGRLSLEAKLSHRFEFVYTLQEVYGSRTSAKDWTSKPCRLCCGSSNFRTLMVNSSSTACLDRARGWWKLMGLYQDAFK